MSIKLEEEIDLTDAPAAWVKIKPVNRSDRHVEGWYTFDTCQGCGSTGWGVKCSEWDKFPSVFFGTREQLREALGAATGAPLIKGVVCDHCGTPCHTSMIRSCYIPPPSKKGA